MSDDPAQEKGMGDDNPAFIEKISNAVTCTCMRFTYEPLSKVCIPGVLLPSRS